MKHMLDISEKLIVEQSDEIFGVTPINWEDSSWKLLPVVGDQSLEHKSVRILRFCIVLGRGEPEPTIKYCLGRQSDVVEEFITIQSS